LRDKGKVQGKKGKRNEMVKIRPSGREEKGVTVPHPLAATAKGILSGGIHYVRLANGGGGQFH